MAISACDEKRKTCCGPNPDTISLPLRRAVACSCAALVTGLNNRVLKNSCKCQKRSERSANFNSPLKTLPRRLRKKLRFACLGHAQVFLGLRKVGMKTARFFALHDHAAQFKASSKRFSASEQGGAFSKPPVFGGLETGRSFIFEQKITKATKIPEFQNIHSNSSVVVQFQFRAEDSFSTDTSVALIMAKTESPFLRFIRLTDPVVMIEVTGPAAVLMTISETTFSDTICSIVPGK
jgi:hypothetical protein